jgi:trimeric autotransporter adhesin
MSNDNTPNETADTEGSRRWFGKAVLLGAPIVAAGVLLSEQQAAADIGDAWLLGGNTAFGEGLGTSNAAPMVFITQSVERLRIDGIDGRVGIGTDAPSVNAQLHVKNLPATRVFTARFDNAATNGVCVLGNATGPGGRGVTGNAAGTGGSAIAGYGLAPGTNVNGVYGESQTVNGIGVKGVASISDASGVGVRGEAGNIGVYGTATKPTGAGVWGSSSSAVFGSSGGRGAGVCGETTGGSSAPGVYGQAGTYGVYGQSDVYGVYGQTTQGFGVYGKATTTGTGVYGESASNVNPGVRGVALGANASGVVGESQGGALNNPGVRGIALNPNGIGVSGEADGATSRAVQGIAIGGGFAGYFVGNVHVGGALSKSSGTFKIDHPQDPANRYLVHSFVESPEMMNVYAGVVFCDAHGEASVEMPSYFESLNRTFRYQLTALGAAAPNLHVAEDIADGRFRIAGGPPGLRVSWQVTGVRQDAFAEANPIVVEPEKADADRGMFLHPNLFGFDDDRRIGFNFNKLTNAKDGAR